MLEKVKKGNQAARTDFHSRQTVYHSTEGQVNNGVAPNNKGSCIGTELFVSAKLMKFIILASRLAQGNGV